jgi:hypothetical protein
MVAAQFECRRIRSMGGLLKAPSPSTPQSAAAAPVAAVVESDQSDRQRRLDALARQRAGRSGTIVTSARGLLTSAEWLPQRKSLLGE